jgi:hypothetical protein
MIEGEIRACGTEMAVTEKRAADDVMGDLAEALAGRDENSRREPLDRYETATGEC